MSSPAQIRAAHGPPELFGANAYNGSTVVHYGFEWDEEKARANERKHGITFDEAKTAFRDLFALELFDVDHSLDEDRFVLIGHSNRGRVLVVAYTLRDHKTIRIISAREAARQERLEYEKQINS